jgi:arsenate reductase-like glutaredoxin family protein
LKYPSGVEKYRTNRLPKDEFEKMLNYTNEDWENYLNTSENYNLVK